MNAYPAVVRILDVVGGAPGRATGAVLALLFGAICVGAEFSMIAQYREAGRRLRILREDPQQKVRKMPAPFQSSLFGPYH